MKKSAIAMNSNELLTIGMIPIILRGGCPQLPGYKCTKNDVAQIKQAVLQVQMKFPREFRKLIKQYSG